MLRSPLWKYFRKTDQCRLEKNTLGITCVPKKKIENKINDLYVIYKHFYMIDVLIFMKLKALISLQGNLFIFDTNQFS